MDLTCFTSCDNIFGSLFSLDSSFTTCLRDVLVQSRALKCKPQFPIILSFAISTGRTSVLSNWPARGNA